MPNILQTASQETDTCVLTTTFIDTATEWESSTAYETSWTTITEYSTTTPTIQPSPAWTPIHSEVVSKGKVPSKRNLIARAEENSLKINKNDDLVLPPKKFPVRVNCINVIYIVYTKLKVVPASETLTITAATPTVTRTSTHVVEQTLTEFPEDATTTEYVSETSTISVTSTHWETSTIVSSSKLSASHSPTPIHPTNKLPAATTTSIVPAATPYYAACAPENLLTSISGSGLNRIDLTPAQTFVAAGSVPAAYDCCVAGILGGYAGAVFRPKDSQCYVLSTAGGVCDGSAKGFGVWAARAQSPVSGFVVSNGNCGSGRVVAVDGKKFA